MFSNASIHPTDPRAFLVYIMLDEHFQVVPDLSGALQAENPDVLGQLAVTNLRINTNGFLYVYVNNASIRPVFFDNLFINHTSSLLLDKSDYYPFGMLWKIPSQNGDLENNYRYNGKELQKDLALYTEDYGARQYDPVVGRWLQVDPLAENDRKFSPFNYGLGNPVRMIDPDGRTWFDQVMGVAAAVIDNASLGLVNIRDDLPVTDAADYNHGQDLGDIASVLIGADEAATGGGMSTAAVVAIPESGGMSALAVPAGASMVYHGNGMALSGIDNFAAQKGRVNEGKYNNVPDPKNAGAGKKFTPLQKQNLLKENKARNDGQLKSDLSGKPLSSPQQMKKGQKANMNQAEVDHIVAKSNGGTNNSSNAQILSKRENLEKGNK